MKLFIATALATLIAGQAVALSCMRPDPVGSFARFAEDDASYYVLYGTLDFDASLQPKGVVNRERNLAPIAARFKGFGLTQDGFTARYENAVTLQPVCAGPWCGEQMPGIKSLIFAKVTGDTVTVSYGPCGGSVFAEPSDVTLRDMTACMNGNCL